MMTAKQALGLKGWFRRPFPWSRYPRGSEIVAAAVGAAGGYIGSMPEMHIWAGIMVGLSCCQLVLSSFSTPVRP